MIWTYRSRSQCPRNLPFGSWQPLSFNPLIAVIIFTSSSMSLPFMSSLDVFLPPDSSSVCRHVVLFAFCSALQRSTSHSYSPLLSTSSWFDAYYIITPLQHLIHVNVIPIHSTTLRMCMSMFRSSHCPGLIVILPSSLLHLSYTFYSSVLCPPSLWVCFVSHMRIFPFLLQNPTLLIFASLHTPSLCLLRFTDSVNILRPSFPLTHPTASLYTTNQPPHTDLS